MTNSATSRIAFRPALGRAKPASGQGGGGPLPPATDRLWSEHGWSLSGTAVAVLIGAILVASCAVQFLGQFFG